jgi:pimeloyl-ACP methyl ester carboxylesterase
MVVLNIKGYQLRAKIIGELLGNKPVIVMLHGGLDCIETWKDFPTEVAQKTGLAVVVYERFGHGQSGKLKGEIYNINYRHHEANDILLAVLQALGIRRTILVGHSDGGAMALLAAAGLPNYVLGVCAISPPLVAEMLVRKGIQNAVAQYEDGNLAKKLSAFHGDATDGLFYSWANSWLSPVFDNWSCDADLHKIKCSVSLVFGLADEYGYKPSLDLLLRHLKERPTVRLIEKAGHLSHHFARKETLESVYQLTKEFI